MRNDLQVRRAINTVNKVHSNVCGLVLNKVDMSKKRYAYGPYYGMDNRGPKLRAVAGQDPSRDVASDTAEETTNKISSAS